MTDRFDRPEPENTAAMSPTPDLTSLLSENADLRAEIREVRDQAVRERRAALEALYPAEGSNLLRHARRELELAFGDSPESDGYGGLIILSVLDLMRVFAGAGHSGGSAGTTIGLFGALARFDVLTPLTGHPADWSEVDESMRGGSGRLWQSTRKSSVFWREGEETWYDLDVVEATARRENRR